MPKPIYGMSEAGKCPRALSAQRLGYEPEPAPEWLERTAEEGKWHEERIVQLIDSDPSGVVIFDRQQEVALYYPSFSLVGHIDGKITDLNWEVFEGTRLLEIKSMSQFEFDRWMKGGFEAFPQYAAQLTCYMEATGLGECLYIVKNRNNGYEDRRTIVEPPCKLNIDIIYKLIDVENHVLGNELVLKEFDPNNIECKRCEFKYLCVKTKEDMTQATVTELLEATRIVREGRRLMAEGEVLFNEGRDRFKEHTIATGVNKWRFANLVLNLLPVHKESYDKKKLLELFSSEALEPALKVQDYEQFRIDDLEKEE